MTIEEFADEVRKHQENSVLRVPVGDNAKMSFPTTELCWQARYGKNQPTMLMAGALESFRYLVLECTKEEAWRRIKLIREYVSTAPPATGKPCDVSGADGARNK